MVDRYRSRLHDSARLGAPAHVTVPLPFPFVPADEFRPVTFPLGQ